MLRIFFTQEDVARTRIAPGPDPLWELVLSVQMLRGQPGDLLFTGWRRQTALRLRQRLTPPQLRLLMGLIPNMGYFPDFLNPAAAIRGLDHGLEAIRSTPKSVLVNDLSRLVARRRGSSDASALASGDPTALSRLTDAMSTYHHVAVQSQQDSLGVAVEHDRSVRLRALVDGGVAAMFNSLRPMMMWSAGELRVPAHRDQEITLGGRGLVLVPSYFCVNHPVTLFDESLRPVLIYPITRTVASGFPHPPADQSLAALIGTTRAAILEAIAGGATTTEIARRVGVSAANASEHATVLRNAGLVVSYRSQNRVVHHTTPLGGAILRRG